MLIILTLGIMAAVAFVHLKEGLFTAATTCVNVLIAGMIAFNFFEPLAGMIGRAFFRTFLQGYEDFLALIFLFAASLGLLRGAVNNLNDTIIELPPAAQQVGGGIFGLLTGYLVSGLLICAMETLPWGAHFLDFEPRAKDESALRSVMPPDRVWLAMMSRASAGAFARSGEVDHAFDPYGAFEQNYLRLRRYPDSDR